MTIIDAHNHPNWHGLKLPNLPNVVSPRSVALNRDKLGEVGPKSWTTS